MNIHEYQTKDLLRHYGVPVPSGHVVHTETQAAKAAEEIGGSRWVVKAQIHSGGRGKAGGVRVGSSINEVKKIAGEIIGSLLVTHQTGAEGRLVRRVLVEQASKILHEYYVGLIIDRATRRVTLVASSAGGVDIEVVAQQTPELIIREVIDPAVGLLDFQCRKVAYGVGLKGPLLPQAVKIMKGLYRCLRDSDATMAEINPLAVVEGNQLLALDAKMSFDDNALYRRPTILELRDFDEEDPKEVDATGHGLNYIALDGDVGCIVNGAGLAMATMDAIALHGGRPANFLDVGGGATPEKVANAFRIVLQDPAVKIILINIFAGINRCDWIATGIIQAMRDQNIKMPIIVRLAGTNVEEGRAILSTSKFPFIIASNLNDAAEKAMIEVKKIINQAMPLTKGRP
ncbi:MAG: ADP-forming succinate--CoA ligase subunit beta [Candidatus Nitrotoga sp.]|nr:ADP-forming succinate--CoA ligase subunit beta [Candidatus Nitrotoga sp.]MDW7604978.1 ADP-forming succinate--CoA ligase subunit beta [Candidatus Nitrotoga sp.]MDW7612905.1 ADP-forming succinate--CoA ligase subunit beta [Candidatus Nitrotoga sp.]MDW7626128.1 ADP-forming succinate--CoA ligase subunit beta [Candidatus Nitrotoga sp.]